MLLDRETLSEVLRKSLAEREERYSQLQEMNSFSEEDDTAFAEKTKKLEQLRDEINAHEFVLKDDYLRLAADFDNYKKRTAKAESQAYDKAKAHVLFKLFDAYDILERICKVESGNAAIKPVLTSFEKAFAELGCTKTDCKPGDKLDVSCMEAIAVRDSNSFSQDSVIEIFQPGWKLACADGVKVICPAKVVVAK